jgi:hypothetical protein
VKSERRVLGPTVLFIARRTATSIALLALTSVVIFVVMRVIPGDPTITKLGGSIRDLDPQTLRDVRHQLGLDHSLRCSTSAGSRDGARNFGCPTSASIP